jgi:hypothetical protein
MLARVAGGLSVSVALHWGAWQVVDGIDAPAMAQTNGTVASVAAVASPTPAVSPTTTAFLVAAASALDPQAPAERTRLAAPPRAMHAGDATVGTGRRDPAVTRGGSRPAPAAPSSTGASPGVVYHEAWDVDRAAEFLYPPLGLDELHERVRQAGGVTLALRVDATGRLVDVEVVRVRGFDDDDVRLVREMFADIPFAPALRAGAAVASVQRFELNVDPRAPLALGFGQVPQ